MENRRNDDDLSSDTRVIKEDFRDSLRRKFMLIKFEHIENNIKYISQINSIYGEEHLKDLMKDDRVTKITIWKNK